MSNMPPVSQGRDAIAKTSLFEASPLIRYRRMSQPVAISVKTAVVAALVRTASSPRLEISQIVPAPTRGMRRTNSRCVDGESKFMELSKQKKKQGIFCGQDSNHSRHAKSTIIARTPITLARA
jgi:hypothetical protein